MQPFKQRLIVILLPALLLTGCSQMEFAPVDDLASSAPTDDGQNRQETDQNPQDPPQPPPVVVPPPHDPVCRVDEVVVQKPTKVLFVIDQSGSNVNGPFGHPGEATDPLKSFRSGVISQFYAAHGAKSHLSWGTVTFNGTSAQALIHVGDAQQGMFSNNPLDMGRALATFQRTPDVGNTPYRAALALVRRMIEDDIAMSLEPSHYLIAFITDGNPTDYCAGGPLEVFCPGRVLETEIDADVKRIRDLAPRFVQFSSIYYGPPDREAARRLSRMAGIGGGEFVDTNTSLSLNLDDVLRIPQPICE